MFVAPEGTLLVEHLGGGTMFDVAVVRQKDALLACKRLKPRMRAEPTARAALVREARFLSVVRTAALPAILRVGADASGPFVLETRVAGTNLGDLGEAWRARGQAVPPRLVAYVCGAAAAALAELHEAADGDGALDAVHGDLAPDHLIFGPIGDIGFIDFGASRARGVEVDALDKDARGTLPFVAPELARGDVPASAATDVFALAATLVAFATGQALTHATDEAAQLVEVAERGVRKGLCERVEGLTAAGRRALEDALAFERDARLTSARALATALAPTQAAAR